MLAGELYNSTEPDLVDARLRSQRLCNQYNQTDPAAFEQRRDLLAHLFEHFGEKSEILPPFYCDYGSHIRIGGGSFLNFNCIILDCNRVTIGDRVLIGPSVQIYTASHPLDSTLRAALQELALSITIEDDVWIGGGAIICPGITIGTGSTIGAGSVVTRRVPPHVFAAGNPCKVIRPLTDRDEDPRQ
jgi:maltose O-acetyltransferase